jgi:L-threonylcarbamoyladenylate synthase
MTDVELVSAAPRAGDAVITRAAALLRAGELVAFPTETVYGLGANALDSRAVARIYLAKGRPSHNPLIVHVADAAAARHLVLDWPVAAEELSAKFWPGPLTLVLPKQPAVPDLVTARLGTVAVRVPRHPVALALLQASGIPIAAPSANRSERISPTTAAHVRSSLGGRIPLVLDGGATDIGIESTVVDLSGTAPRLLRPGMITAAEIEAVLGIRLERAETGPGDRARSSPGQLERHYAPRAPVRLFERGRPLAEAGAGAIVFTPGASGQAREIQLPDDPTGYAHGLYAALHTLDSAAVSEILIEAPPAGAPWDAIRDRLLRASHP